MATAVATTFDESVPNLNREVLRIGNHEGCRRALVAGVGTSTKEGPGALQPKGIPVLVVGRAAIDKGLISVVEILNDLIVLDNLKVETP